MITIIPRQGVWEKRRVCMQVSKTTERNVVKQQFVTLGTFETKSSSVEWLYLYKYLSDTRVTV